ncbi:MAG: class I SAM-dependent methyltransferase [Promethearchaeota archaeon]
MFAKWRAWRPLFSLGSMSARRQELEDYSVFLVLRSLDKAGIFDALKEPKSIDELVEKFGWEYPSDYVDDLIDVLLNDNILKKVDNKLSLDKEFKLEEPEVYAIEDFNAVFEEYAEGIPNRLKGEFRKYTGRLALYSWDSALASNIYQAIRDSAFGFINIKELYGARILDAGCGPGYETADMWTKLIGKNSKIIAVEPDPDLLNIARNEFTMMLAQKGFPGLKWEELENPPEFIQGAAQELKFEDNSFDVVYFSNFLHWLTYPLDGIKEMVRVLKPGGLIFGGQGTTEVTSPWLNLTARVIEGAHGYFSRKQFLDWFREAGIASIKTATLVNTFKGRKPK